MKKHIRLKFIAPMIGILGLASSATHAATWKVEAEKAGPGNTTKVLPDQPIQKTWEIEKFPEASEGAVLAMPINGYGYTETNPIPVVIPQAGTYRVWVRHFHTRDRFSSFYILFRNNLGQAVDFHNLDFKANVASAKPELSPTPPPKPDPTAKPELVWTSFDITFEYPCEGTISFGPSQGLTNGRVGVDCVIITDDKAFDPAKADLAKISADPGPQQTVTPPKGMVPAPVITATSSFFSGETNPDNQIHMAFINQTASYLDYAWGVQMGANFDHGWTNGSDKYGISIEATADYGYMNRDILAKIPEPTGRFVDSTGKVGKHPSLSYEPATKAYLEKMGKQLQNFKDIKDVRTFMVSDEGSGYFDYSDAARDAFHKWLSQRFTTIDKLNSLWRTQYKNFDEIPLPQKPKDTDNKASWFAFREFSGLELANFIAGKAKVIREQDTRHRRAISQSSCLEINSPTFTAGGPMDFEDVINIGFAHEPEFGVDAYSTADSFVGCDIDFLLSLTKGKRLLDNEFNVHSQDPRNMSQAYWAMIGKGVKGVATWCFQATPNLWMYYMWGLLNPGDTPRDKLGVIADANLEVRRMERILGPAKAQEFVKPVALYYSRLDLSVPQTTLGIYSGSIDSPYRIYSILRGLGYPVRWITPKQIIAGELKGVSAVFMLGATHVPGDAAKTLAQWVKDGGSIAGDQWPGAFDEYDRTQTTLLDVFGIRPAETAPVMDKAAAKSALEQTSTPVAGGIDPEVLRSLNADELFKNVEEMWEQYDSTHPVAQAVGNWHLSGFELKKAKVISPTAEVIGMSMGRKGYPGMLINNYGKGHALYSAIMLGTLFETGPVAFEWDTAREGPGLVHIINAYLHFCDVEPLSQVDLPERMGWRMRVETPLADAKGNIFVGVTSLNESPITTPFSLSLRWPVAAPKMLMIASAGSRQMTQLPFTLKDGKLKATLPGFDTAVSLLALTNSAPLISLDITGAPRGVGGLLDVTPGTRLKVKATVWNPSAKELPAGQVNFFADPGWFCNAGEQKISGIKPYGHQEVNFEVEAPALCTKYSLKPLVFKYESGKVTATPCTEIVWWKAAAAPKTVVSKN
ncbi:MAG: beta-galactosidase [Chthoniobacterales bacterium]